MTSKFYAVKKGRKIGIFTSWEACKEQIIGFSGGQYKSFTTEKAAKAYLANDLLVNNEYSKNIDKKKYEAIAYTDGSFMVELQQFSYGLVFIHNSKKSTYYEKFDDKNWVKLQNVAGEIMGAQKAMQLAVQNKVKSLLICHDYSGISKWCTGKWKTIKIETRSYQSFYNKIIKDVKVDFKWVKGHSGDLLNDEADMLAAKAFQLSKISEPIS